MRSKSLELQIQTLEQIIQLLEKVGKSFETYEKKIDYGKLSSQEMEILIQTDNLQTAFHKSLSALYEANSVAHKIRALQLESKLAKASGVL